MNYELREKQLRFIVKHYFVSNMLDVSVLMGQYQVLNKNILKGVISGNISPMMVH
jgi:hypothetical protein